MSKHAQGRLIVVEGLDGVGKTVVSRALAARLGATWTTTPDPALRPLRALIDVDWGDPTARSLFYASTVVAAGAASAFRRGDVVVDRYWLTTRAYAGLAGAVDLDALDGMIAPADVTIYLTVDEGERASRLAARGLSAADRWSLEAYRELDRRYRADLSHPCAGASLVVDTTGRSPERVVEDILRSLPRLGRPQLDLFSEASP